jgi:hypothetical protein
MAERLLDIQTPVDTIVNAFARHGLLIALNLFVVSLACRVLVASQAQRMVGAGVADEVQDMAPLLEGSRFREV